MQPARITFRDGSVVVGILLTSTDAENLAVATALTPDGKPSRVRAFPAGGIKQVELLTEKNPSNGGTSEGG